MKRREVLLPPVWLDGFEIQRTGLAVAVRAHVIGQALAGGRRVGLNVPFERAALEAEVVAACLGLDGAATLVDVERVDGAKIFHVEFLRFQAPELATCRLGDVKDRRKVRLAPKTVLRLVATL
jgi:hypothetical protein